MLSRQVFPLFLNERAGERREERGRERQSEREASRKKAESKIETSDYSFIHSLAGDQIKDTTARPGKTPGHATDTGVKQGLLKCPLEGQKDS